MITADQGVRGGKVIELKKTVVDAVARCPLVTAILTAKRTGNPVVSSPLDVDLDEVILLALSTSSIHFLFLFFFILFLFFLIIKIIF